VFDVVLRQVGPVGAERVGLDTVHTDVVVGTVNVTDHLRSGHIEDLVTAFEVFKIGQRKVGLLQHRPHGAIGDNDPTVQGFL